MVRIELSIVLALFNLSSTSRDPDDDYRVSKSPTALLAGLHSGLLTVGEADYITRRSILCRHLASRATSVK